MAKSFIAIKKAIGLYDIIDFGKYNGCRVDSIVEQDYLYIEYTRINFDKKYSQEVLDLIEAVKSRPKKIAHEHEHIEYRNPWVAEDYNIEDDDIPF